MNDPALVRVLERFGDLARDVGRFGNCKAPSFEPDSQVLAGDQFHREEADTARLVKPVDRADVWMVQRCEHLRFTFEPRQPLGVARKIRGQDLDRDVAVERRIGRPPDRAHPAFAELFDDAVMK